MLRKELLWVYEAEQVLVCRSTYSSVGGGRTGRRGNFAVAFDERLVRYKP